jgi:hypothetical protein
MHRGMSHVRNSETTVTALVPFSFQDCQAIDDDPREDLSERFLVLPL